jgi:hypothetical protein
MSDDEVRKVIRKNGNIYLLAMDGRLFKAGTGTSCDKFIGWLVDGKYTPSPSILRNRDRIDQEAKRRLDQERDANKKVLFESAVRRRMDELRRS